MKRNRDLRLAKIEVLRKEIATLTDTEIMERLEETFSHYCDKVMCHSTGIYVREGFGMVGCCEWSTRLFLRAIGIQVERP